MIVGVLPLQFGIPTVYGQGFVARLPARSTATALTLKDPGTFVLASRFYCPSGGPESASVQVTGTPPTWLGVNVGAGVPQVITGGTVSRITVVDTVVVPPPDVAVHVNVVPAVSEVTVAASQPEVAEISDSGSETSQVTVTSDRYQPCAAERPAHVRAHDGLREVVGRRAARARRRATRSACRARRGPWTRRSRRRTPGA